MTEMTEQPHVPQPPSRPRLFANLRSRFSAPAALDSQQPVYPTLYAPVTEMPKFEGPAVRDEWADAVVDGIANYPSINVGIGVTIASAVINNPPHDWNDLAISTLSKAQVDRMGAKMSDLHRARGIHAVHDSSSPKPGDVTIDDERFYSLWRSFRSSTLILMRQNLPEGDLNKVLGDPNNFQALSLKIASLKESLSSEQVAFLLKMHKQVMNRNISLQVRFAKNPDLARIVEDSGVDLDSDPPRGAVGHILISRIEDLVKDSAIQNRVNVSALVH